MAFAHPVKTKRKPATHSRKRTGAHHRRSKQYAKHYLPYLPIAAIVSFGFAANVFIQNQNEVLGANASITDSQLLSSTNAERNKHEAAPLKLDNILDKAAQEKADDMVSRNYWSHSTPDGTAPWQFMHDSGYNYSVAGENLAYGFKDSDTAIKAWMRSPEHKVNILDEEYSQVGFGIATSDNFAGKGSQTIIVAFYARPSMTKTSFTPAGTGGNVLGARDIAPISVSRFSLLASTSIAMLSTLLVVFVVALGLLLARHAHYLHKVIVRGEYAVLRHPVLDITITAFIVVVVLLLQNIGTIL